MKKKLTEAQVLRTTCKLLGCSEANIDTVKGMMFMVVKYSNDSKIVAKGSTLEALWKDVLAYSKSLMK